MSSNDRRKEILVSNQSRRVVKSWVAIGFVTIAGYIFARAYVLFKKDDQLEIQKKLAKEFGFEDMTRNPNLSEFERKSMITTLSKGKS